MSKSKNSRMGIVYSTDPSFISKEENEHSESTLPPAQQKLRIRLETKQRGGKAVTLVEGFTGASSDAEELGKKLKSFCGTGGSVKDREILVQGDNRDKVLAWLLKNDYKQSKKIG